ncbi:MAG TPA: DinB family protein [Fimbriimonas sp.]|nr:DinB family protein [Fimbriimonas sp.]
MRYQDQMVRATQKALEDVVRSAQALPPDKLDWVPMGVARSVLDQMQEIAMGGTWFMPIVRELKMPDHDTHALEEARRRRTENDTLEKCVVAARQSTSELCEAIETVSDENLEDEIHLPFGGGMTVTLADVLGMHAWNMIYHLGQINQIQLMLGDRAMH